MPRVCLAASGGGHLEVLRRVRPRIAEPIAWIVSQPEAVASARATGDAVHAVPLLQFGRRARAHNVARGVGLAIRLRPRVVVCAGAGSVVAFAVAARALGAHLVFIETMARVTTPSATARVLGRLAQDNLVQWPELAAALPRATLVRPVLWESSPSSSASPKTRRGTAVAVGSHTDPFDRLVAAVDEAVGRQVLPHPVSAQTGAAQHRPRNFNASESWPGDELERAIGAARYVVCHAGSGIVSTALRAGHKPLVMARRVAQGEHVDDHQLDLLRKLVALGLVVEVEDSITAQDVRAADAGRPALEDVVRAPAMWDVLDGILAHRG